MQTVAIFDLDNTLVRGASLYHFGTYLVRRRALSFNTMARFAMAQRRYLRGGGEQEAAAAKAARLGLGLIAGRHAAELSALTEDFAHRLATNQFDRGALDEVRSCQARETPCFIATASPQELAEAIARRLGMDGAFGTVLEVADERYTGNIVGPICHGEMKAQRVRRGLESLGLDLSDAVAYSDSVNDLPLLASAGAAVVVNADTELLVIAERNGWRVIPGRRDQSRAVQSLLAHLPFPM